MSNTYNTDPLTVQAWRLPGWAVSEWHNADCDGGESCDILTHKLTTPARGTRWRMCRIMPVYYGAVCGGARHNQHAYANWRERQARTRGRAENARVASEANAALRAGEYDELDAIDVWVPRRSVAWDLW